MDNKKTILLQSNNNSINNEKDIEKLRLILFEKKKNLENLNKRIKEKNNNLLKMKNNLDNEKNIFNQEKNIFYNKSTNNNTSKNIINDENFIDTPKAQKIEELKNKCLMNEKEYEAKQQELSKIKNKLLEKKQFLQNFINKNNNLIKLKENEYNQKNISLNHEEEQFEQKRITFRNNTNIYMEKEDNLNNKEKELNEKENELKLKENNLKEREQKINDENIKNDEKEKEIDEKINEINEKLIYMKNKEYLMNIKKDEDKNNDSEDIDEKELEKIQQELEEQMNIEEKQIEKNNNQKPESSLRTIIIPKQNSLMNSFETTDSTNYRKTLSPNNFNNKYKNHIHFTEQKEINGRYTINPNSNNNNNIQNNNVFNFGKKSTNNNFIRSKTISSKDVSTNNINISLNNNYVIKPSLNPSVLQTQTKINKNLPSLGLEKTIGPINLNAIIQCFAHIPEISEGILELGYNKFFKERKNMKLSRNFATIINNIFFPMKFNNNSRKYSPKLFVETFLNMYPQKIPNTYLSTLKIVKFIMETLHDELNIKKINDDEDSDDIDNDNDIDNIDNSNEKEVLVKFLTKLTENNNSLISKLFYGLIKIKCVCNNCGNSTYAFDYYSYLYFDLIAIKKYMLNNKFGNNNSLFLSLNDCLDYYRRPITITSSLKDINKSFFTKFNINEQNGNIFCNKCKSEKKGTLNKIIFSAHTILPIIL